MDRADVDEPVAAALEAAFPDREIESVGPAGVSWNEGNRTVAVECSDGERAYLKVSVDGNGERFARERAVASYVREHCPVAVPTILASDPGADPPYFATAPMPGTVLVDDWADADDEERARMVREVGRTLAAVHSQRFDRHGHVTGGDADGLDLDHGPWSAVLIDTIRDLRSRVPDDRFDHYFDAVIAAVEADRSRLDDAPAALLHGDPAKPNCFRTDDGIGLIDWEVAHVGDPARDCYRARDQQFTPIKGDPPRHLLDAFHDGYRERAGSLPDGYRDRTPVYAAVRLLGVAGFVEETAAFLDDSPDEFATWIDGELQRRLDRI